MAGRPVSLDVTFVLTDLEHAPIAGTAVRVVFGSDPGWREPGAGDRLVTDARGESRFSSPVTLDRVRRKVPTNFWSSLVTPPAKADRLMVAAELPYMEFRWLYAVDLYRFADSGDVLLDGLSVYTPDADGRFTRKATHDDDGWTMAELGGLVLTTPGHAPWDFTLAPDPGDPMEGRWTLRLGFRRSPAPIRR
jgi:hypothetical protein